ncbi:MAG: hypothetical protein OEY19_09530 [Gammaproteobacteria bacterium]|nr:hypothetical protein [Gammaproteobacteria bacterium]MDH5629521.1 hypothetical protein [Gammaproteobacteria bacterium]
MKNLATITVICLLITMMGCQTIPKDAFVLKESMLAERNKQSRLFETEDEVALLSAGIGVLQDMGFAIDATEKKVGLISASKMADATEAGQVVLSVFLSLLSGGDVPFDDEQKIRVSLITIPSQKGGYIARITFQRIIWDTAGRINRVETIKDDQVYIDFFDKLAKSVFLEAHKI